MPRAAEPKNVAGIRKWMTQHRPDLLHHLDNILESEAERTAWGQAMFLLLAVGFAAGRQYQQENSTDLEPA